MEIQELLFRNLDKVLSNWFVIDQDFTICHWSQSAQEALGYPEKEVLGQRIGKILATEQAERLFQTGNPSIDHTNSIIDLQIPFRQQNNIIVEVDLSIYPIQDEEEQLMLITFEKITEIIELRQFANSKKLQLLSELKVFDKNSTSQHLKDIYDAILVAVTSGHGLQFNRAFLLMVNQTESLLEGVQAIGPNDMEEAGKIYSQQDNRPNTLFQMIQHYQQHKGITDIKVNEIVKQLSTSLDQKDHILVQTLFSQRYKIVNDQNQHTHSESFHQLRTTLHSHECILVPLVWHSHSIGLLIVDNAYTRLPISDSSIKRLLQFTQTAVDVLISVHLMSRLEESLNHVQKAHEKLQQSQEMLIHQEKLSTKGQMMEQMAHEVRGPLAVIGGFASRVYKTTDPNDPNYNAIGRISETTKTLELVLNGILHTESTVTSIPLFSDASKCVNRVINLLEEEILTRKISVNLELQGNLPHVKITEHHLFEIINNLVKNALEAMGQDGLLSIKAITTEGSITLTITDTGPGVSEEQSLHIFQPYFTTKKEGTGLGLVVVKNLIEEYNGNLSLVSKEGEGTTFILTIPALEEANLNVS